MIELYKVIYWLLVRGSAGTVNRGAGIIFYPVAFSGCYDNMYHGVMHQYVLSLRLVDI